MGPWIVILFWILLSIVVASVARRRGFSFWAYLLHCYLPSPFVALITLHFATRLNLSAAQPQAMQ
ncbi:MAG TPA: hypothetical protein VJ553_05320 [Candidatus Paceibacterota bacterium]|nr:hypothetical protein [Candidatus Paceibacterota bacterium]